MGTATFLKTFVASLLTFLIIDFAWLGLIARGFYRNQLGHLLSPDVRWVPAIIFYLLFVAGIVVFVVTPAFERGSLLRAVALGGFFGVVAYATYDLTNLATMRDFPLVVAVVDMVWGGALSAIVATVGYYVAARG